MTTEEGGMEHERPPGESRSEGDGVRSVLLGSAEDWFASALRSMLEPAGIAVVRAISSSELRTNLGESMPDLVILDSNLPPEDPPELLRTLLDGILPRHVPILCHTSGGRGGGAEDTQMLDAGAWCLLDDPIRPAPLISQLHRLFRIGRAMDANSADGDPYVDRATGLSTLSGLGRLLPSVTDLARRQGVPVTFAAIGPTERASGEGLRKQRRRMADLCRRHVRQSDFVGWLHDGGDSDVAVVAFATTRSGAENMARRLASLSEEPSVEGGPGYSLSAGILERKLDADGDAGRAEEDGSRLKGEMKGEGGLDDLAAVRSALGEARRSGGGIRFVNGV